MPVRDGGALSVGTKLAVLQLIVVVAACGFFFFYSMDALGLMGADEPRYAQIGREMLERHDWVVPTLNGTPWLEKPVLLYWMEIVAYRAYGVHDWVARIPSALLASALVISIFFFMRRFRAGSELDAALITVSMAGVLGFARGASTDMPVSAPLCMALLAWWAWNETEKKSWLAVFYVLLAVGALAKGPVAPAFAVLIVGAYAVLRREGKIFFRTIWWPGLALFFAVALPWYIAVQNRVPQFFHVFFVEHNLERFGTNLYRHSQPFWYYIPVFVLATVPWIAIELPAMGIAIRDLIARVRNFGEDTASEADEDNLVHFLLLWILIPIIFFSISRSKLPGYILPAIPPAGILTAAFLYRLPKMPPLMLMLHSLVCGAILGGALLTPWLMYKLPVPTATRNIVIFSAGLAAISVLAIIRWRGIQVVRFATLLPMVLAMTFLLFPAVANLVGQKQSARPVDARLRELGVAAQPLVVFEVKREVDYGLNFYRNQRPLHYDQDGIPGGAHVVVTRQGNGDAVRALAGREATSLGVFAPQHLEFFAVAARNSNPEK